MEIIAIVKNPHIVQTTGLLFDICGALIISNWLKKIKYDNTSPYGIHNDLAKIFSDIANKPIIGTRFLIIGFILQLIATWLN